MNGKGVLLLAGAVALASCEPGDPVAEPDSIAHARADRFVTTSVFGEVAPDSVVATCGDTSIVAADVALWLHLFPVLTVDQAIEDLLDLCVVEQTVETQPLAMWEGYEADARMLARAAAWVLHTVVLDESLVVPAEQIDAWVAAPENQTEFGHPELRVVSHVVALVAEDATPETQAAAEALIRRVFAALAALPTPVDRAALAAAVDSVRADAGSIELNVETELRFPRRYAGPRNWEGGLDAVVDEFADAAFTTDVGAVFPPTRTSYGWHVGVVEAIEPEDMVPADARREKAHATLRNELLRATMDSRLRELFERTDVRVDPEAVNLLTTDAMQRIANANRQD